MSEDQASPADAARIEAARAAVQLAAQVAGALVTIVVMRHLGSLDAAKTLRMRWALERSKLWSRVVLYADAAASRAYEDYRREAL